MISIASINPIPAEYGKTPDLPSGVFLYGMERAYRNQCIPNIFIASRNLSLILTLSNLRTSE